MKLVHSPHTSLKRLAAMNITKFFKAFPDLEEDAINGIYDLCEDHDPDVRRSPHVIPRNPDFPLPASSPRCELKDTRLSFECQRSSLDG